MTSQTASMHGGWSRRVARFAFALGLASAALGATAMSAGAVDLGPCSSARDDHTQCGVVPVPLDRSGVVPGTVGLRVRVQPPVDGSATATVLALAGGPGQAATPLLDTFASALGPALPRRQLVTFDQRGTGGSSRLICRGLDDAHTQAEFVSGCATQLGPGRADFTTAASVEDVEAVRAALGVDRMVVWGTSYGTKVALAYAAAYPQHVERLVLDSVVKPEGIDPFARTTIGSIPRVLRTLCAHACHFTRDPVHDLAALVRKLAKRPLRGTVIDNRGHRQHVSVVESDLLSLLVAGDLDPALRAGFPSAVHAALHGDSAPLARLASGVGEGPSGSGDSDALYLATSCEDGGVPWPAGTPVLQRRAAVDAAIAAVPSSALAPFDRATARDFGNADLCRAWPESPIAQPQPPLPATPTLILSGDDDLRTPRSDAVALAGRLSGAQLLEVPDTGHSVLTSDLTDCSQEGLAAFLDGNVPGHCRAHPRGFKPLSLPPLSLRSIRRPRGISSPRAGRTVSAAVLTLNDVTDQVVTRLFGSGSASAFGGLRAGDATLDARGIHLHGYVYVPGVTLTGLVPTSSKSFTLTVSGRAAARGRLKFTPKLVTGTLGGVRIRVTAKELARKPLSAAAARAAQLAASMAGGDVPALRLPGQLPHAGAR
jgi:pimeloyl-ACP methyl ester carboxylesterase